MADIKIATGRFTMRTGTGHQFITGVGFRPSAYVLFLTNGTANGFAGNADALLSVGLCNGNSVSLGSGSADNLGTSDVGRRGTAEFDTNKNNLIAFTIAGGTQTIQGRAEHLAFGTDGFAINVTTAFANPTGRIIHYIAFGGADLTVEVGTVDLNNTQDNSVTEDIGFEPDLLLFPYNVHLFDSETDSDNDDLDIGFGWAVNPNIQAANNQFNAMVAGQDAQGAANTVSRFDNVRGGTGWRDAAVDASFEITAWSSTGFTVTTRLSIAAARELCAYMALKLGDNPLVYTVEKNTPTLTGNVSETGVGFKPGFLMGIASPGITTANSFVDGAALALGFTDGISQYAISFFDEDAADPTNTDTYITDSSLLYGVLDSGAADYEADLVSLDSDGWTLNYPDAAGGAYKEAWLAIGTSSSSSSTSASSSSSSSSSTSSPVTPSTPDLQWTIDTYCSDDQWVIDEYCKDEQWLPSSSSSSTSSSSTSSSSSSTSSSSSSSSSSTSSSSSMTPGTKTWGQKTGIQEDYKDPFYGYWTGDGTIDGTNNDEVMLLTCPPEEFESEPWWLGTGRATIRHDKYQTGSGGNVTKYYRTATTEAGLSAIPYTEFDVEFTSLGWVQIYITNVLGE